MNSEFARMFQQSNAMTGCLFIIDFFVKKTELDIINFRVFFWKKQEFNQVIKAGSARFANLGHD